MTRAADASEYSILRNVTRADIRREPYPHLIIENCLPAQLYAQLAGTYPSDDTILQVGGSTGSIKENSRHDVGAHRIRAHPESFGPEWHAFVDYHVSNAFFQQFLRLLGPEVLATYPDLERRLGRSLTELTTGIRYDPQAHGCQIALDCHIGINTPAARRNSVRRVHTDAPDELFAALLYFRREADALEGGDLEIFRWRDPRERLFVGSEVDESDAELVSTVSCKANTAVIFINSDHALHAVSERSPSRASRRLVNIMGRVHHSIPEGLFRKSQKTGLVALARRALQRYRIAAGRF